MYLSAALPYECTGRTYSENSLCRQQHLLRSRHNRQSNPETGSNRPPAGNRLVQSGYRLRAAHPGTLLEPGDGWTLPATAAKSPRSSQKTSMELIFRDSRSVHQILYERNFHSGEISDNRRTGHAPHACNGSKRSGPLHHGLRRTAILVCR